MRYCSDCGGELKLLDNWDAYTNDINWACKDCGRIFHVFPGKEIGVSGSKESHAARLNGLGAEINKLKEDVERLRKRSLHSQPLGCCGASSDLDSNAE